MGRSEGAEGISRGIAAVATSNATLLAGGPRRRGSTRGGALPRRQRHKVSRKDFAEEQRNERRWVSTRSTIEGGRGCNKFVPVLRGNGTKIAPIGNIFDQPLGGMSWIRGKLADHVGDRVVLSPEEGALVTSLGTESSYPRPP